MSTTTRGWLAALAGVLVLALCSAVRAEPSRDALRVCAPPHNPPFSTIERDGFENRIAELFAADLGVPVEYTWFPQRIGFIRNTLRNNDTPDGRYRCDLVMGVVENFELAATTRPYYRSTWVMVYAKGRGIDDVRTPEDLANLPPERLRTIRIGIFDRSPAAQWVLAHGLMDYAEPYQIMSGDARWYAGKVIEDDLASGKVDVTFVWGPIGGYFAHKVGLDKVAVVPMRSEPGIRFDFQIAMAVRFGEREWLAEVNRLIEKHQPEIDAILTEYHVPLLPLVIRERREDDDD